MYQKKSTKRKKRGVPSREDLYVKVASHAKDAIDVIVGIMTGRRRSNAVMLGAAKTILNKVLPDLKAQEISAGEGGEPIKVILDPRCLYPERDMDISTSDVESSKKDTMSKT